MRAAIYARVSTERQERQQTIESQVTALRAWALEQGHELAAEHVFRDEGYSGSRLDRPGLDGLRDAVRDGMVEVVAVLSPDRLARKYAYQVLLLGELRRAGCQVTFLHHPISDDPNDQLLLQIQGAIAEYERAVLAERFRRGKLQKAREGGVVGGKGPYGYRYEPRRGDIPARLVVDEAEAGMVRQLYGWMVEDGLSVRQCIRRLNEGPWVTRSGRKLWSSSVVYHILTDPAYVGTAYANRHEYVVPARPRPGPHRGRGMPGRGPAGVRARVISGSPSRFRRSSTRRSGIRCRRGWRATPRCPSGATRSTTTCCAACSSAATAALVSTAALSPARARGAPGATTAAPAPTRSAVPAPRDAPAR